MKKANNKILEIIEKCGGSLEIAYKLKLSQAYVSSKWPQRGIPLKYWEDLMLIGGLSIEELWRANKNLI